MLRDIIDSGVIPVVRLTRILLHEAGGAGAGGGDHRLAGHRPTAQGLSPDRSEYSGTHTHAAGCSALATTRCGSCYVPALSPNSPNDLTGRRYKL